MSRNEIEDNHDIIQLSREALQDSPAAAFCGGCCVTTPNTICYFVLGDSDNSIIIFLGGGLMFVRFTYVPPNLFKGFL